MSAAAAKRKLNNDQRLILWLVGIMALLILGVTLLAPQQDAEDPVPRSTNPGPLGTEAAYLTLQALGHKTSRWNNSLAELNSSLTDAQADNTTLVLLAPVYDATEEPELRAQLKRFFDRGGHLLITGHYGARLLNGTTDTPELLQSLCRTQPSGDSALARAGHIEISNHGGWKPDDKNALTKDGSVSQTCGKNAVVVSFFPGKGEAVWWSSETPIVNAELKQDSALKLILASIDGREYSTNAPPRAVIFDEAMHTITRTQWSVTHGLPILWVSLQCALLFALLVFSFSRRRGPVRMPVTLPRSSPVEFATSMGDLYEKGEATAAVTEAARRRLQHALTHDLGLASETVLAGPAAIEAAIVLRLGVVARPLATSIAEHLREAHEAAQARLSLKSTLRLAQALSEDAEHLRAALHPAAARPTEELQTAGPKESQ